MTDTNANLEYVANVLRKSNTPTAAHPLIYCLWGCVIFAGHIVAEFWAAYTITYWLIAAPTGFIFSAWIGARAYKNIGQSDKQFELQSFTFFLILLVFIFTAVFTKQYLSIFLLVGMAYCLAGLIMDRIMYWIGALYWLIYIGIFTGLVSSNLVIGTVLSLAFFASAWAASHINKQTTLAV